MKIIWNKYHTEVTNLQDAELVAEFGENDGRMRIYDFGGTRIAAPRSGEHFEEGSNTWVRALEMPQFAEAVRR